MKLLLDTHVFLWWRAAATELPTPFRQAIAEPTNEVWVSAAVGWEIVIKRQLGKLEFPGTVAEAIVEEGFTMLALAVRHTDEVARLPDHHRDPFDRILVAQARCEGLTLLTVDPQVLRYDGFGRLDR